MTKGHDLIEPVAPDEQPEGRPLWRQLLWFAGISIVSGACIATIAYILRGLLFI
ncbi:hypothetical protein [Ponticaulis profundi]|uniref:DUF2474 domain-containing protein n=1 Tax=Ponticaulis profundi TaxID=2665222 RepID=A0ABW1SB26_9PROT